MSYVDAYHLFTQIYVPKERYGRARMDVRQEITRGARASTLFTQWRPCSSGLRPRPPPRILATRVRLQYSVMAHGACDREGRRHAGAIHHPIAESGGAASNPSFLVEARKALSPTSHYKAGRWSGHNPMVDLATLSLAASSKQGPRGVVNYAYTLTTPCRAASARPVP